ncbi:MAG: TIGR04255 family protein [Nitrospiraceae bacterium]|nr:MAG: TIGR04255 family protein [Nitrospiraceae bacterium]
MTDYPILSKAPITEAVIDIRVKIREDLRLEQIDSIYNAVSGQYPDKKERYKWEGKLEFKKGSPLLSNAAEAIDGYMFYSANQKQILQTRLDGFTFSRLKPYETWESFRDEAHRLWQLYRDIVSPEITRVALRYINKMDFPLPVSDFGVYLTAAPIVPKGLPQGVSSFLTRTVIHEPEIDAAAIITQSLEQVVNPGILPIIVDIDAFRQKSEGISEEDAWETFERLRHFKNRIFFNSITEKAKEIFQ